MLEIKNLKKKLNNFTLEINNLKIENNDYFVFLGLSGSGKTTLLEIIAGFRKADEGKLILNGEDITKKPINERKIVMCNGRYLFPHLTVKENIGFGIIKEKNNKKIEKIKNICKILKIEHLLNRYPKNLSMGEQQRVALAMALVLEPEIILLDEPLSSLDRLIHEKLLYELREIYNNSNITFIHVTHDFNEAIALAKHMAIIRNGKIEQMGTVDEILKKPKNKFIAEFTGVRNLLNGSIREENGKYIFSNGKIDIHIDYECQCGGALIGIRPEDIMIISHCKCNYRNENIYSGKIVEIFPSSLCTYRVILNVNGLNLNCEVVKCKADKMQLKKDSDVNFCITTAIPIKEL
ncbi:ATP-binding cassette domain-containing protein [Methanothermococcus sp. Ax23]|uniref:ATP-binding cassette domain-containing protein n=1 Tax=Methanothermococcus sp. Ax23 TaxID=3156486 RepID=UPI003BA12055